MRLGARADQRPLHPGQPRRAMGGADRALLDAVRARRSLKGVNGGRLTGRTTPALRAALDGAPPVKIPAAGIDR